MLLSIIIISNRKDRISRLLNYFESADIYLDKWELVVVCDYNFDFSYNMKNLKIIFSESINISEKRNIGIKNASGIYCAFIDDDCIPEHYWLNRAILLTQQEKIDAIEGKTIINIGQKVNYKEYSRLQNRGFRTNNIIYKKELFKKYGYFDERFAKQREDSDIAFTFIENGVTIEYDEKLIVYHEHRKITHFDILKNIFNRRYDPLLYLKHKRLYRKYIKTPFPYHLQFMLLIWIIMCLLYITNNRLYLFCIGLNFLTGSLYIVKRYRGNVFEIVKIFFLEIFWVLISPVILLLVLLFSSVKYRSFLVV